MKMTPLFLMTVMLIAFSIPMLYGITPETIVATTSVLVGSALLVGYEPSTKRHMFGQLGDLGADQIEKEYKEVKASLDKVGGELKEYAEKSRAEVEKLGALSAETKAKVDEVLIAHGENKARLQEVEQRLVNLAKPQDKPEQPKSAGIMVADKLKEVGVSASFRGSHRIEVPRNAITSFDAAGGNLVAPDHRPGIVPGATRMMTVRSLVAPGTTSSNNVEYVRETGFTNAAAPVSENPSTGKPYSEIIYALAQAPVRTIAHMFKASRQILDDLSGLQSQIDARARYGLMISEENQLLLGNGTGNNLSGMVTLAQAFGYESGMTVTAEQRIDRLRLAILQVHLADYPATGIVLNTLDWAMIELLKDGENRYLISRPADGAEPRLWGLPVVSTNSMTLDNFLVGAFSLACQIFDRATAEILVSTENDKDFEKNMVSIRAEERLAFAVTRPEALVTGQFNV